MKKIILIVVIVLAVVGLGYFLFNQDSKPVFTNDFGSVPKDTALLANLNSANLDALSSEGTVMHIHEHLDIIINNQTIVIPAEIGIGTSFISPMHTHDATGVIHIESPVVKDFRLGQFFQEWGIDFSDNKIGNNIVDQNHKLIIAVNGKQITDAANYVFKAHDEIEIWYGDAKSNPALIKSYDFPQGL